MSFLVDTYALIEWYVQRNQPYAPYFDASIQKHLTKLTLLELYRQIYHRIAR